MSTEQEKAEVLTTEIQRLEASGLSRSTDAYHKRVLLAMSLENLFHESRTHVNQAVFGLQAVDAYLKVGRHPDVLRLGSEILDTLPEDSPVRDDIFSAMETAQARLEASLKSLK